MTSGEISTVRESVVRGSVFCRQQTALCDKSGGEFVRESEDLFFFDNLQAFIDNPITITSNLQTTTTLSGCFGQNISDSLVFCQVRASGSLSGSVTLQFAYRDFPATAVPGPAIGGILLMGSILLIARRRALK